MATRDTVRFPLSDNPKALFIIDVQPNTLAESVSHIPGQIARFIEKTTYDAYILVSYHSDESSIFYRQERWFLPKEKAGPVDAAITAAVKATGKPFFVIEKQTRSCFQPGDNTLPEFLRTHSIASAHFVGFDINDCVFSSAISACDHGLFTVVLEELCHSHRGDIAIKDAAVTMLRYVFLSNHRLMPEVETIQIEL